LASVLEDGLYLCFKDLLDELWTLWELVLLAEPILVKSSSPYFCSRAVFSLINLITPLKYGGDFRPYTTIHDPDLSDMVSAETLPAQIWGITNPVFDRTFEDWPHHVVLGRFQERPPLSSSLPSSSRNLTKHHESLFSRPVLVSRHKRTILRDKKLISLLKDGYNHLTCKKRERVLVP
jgi:hypothetical protein